MRLWIAGVSGLLGLHTAWEALNRGWDVVGSTFRTDLRAAPFPVYRGDLSDPEVLARAWAWARADAVVNAAALANVDACEQDPDTARRLNVDLPARLARLAARDGVPLVHVSTDAVFDGRRGDYSEIDTPRPLSVYGRTKWEGEQAVLEAHPAALVVRVNFFGWSLSGTRSRLRNHSARLRAGEEAIPGFSDVWFCPLLANHLARILFALLERRARGLYHAVASRCWTKYQFGRSLARIFGYDPDRIRPVSVEAAGLPARRGHRLTLRTEKLARTLGALPPTPEEGLRAFRFQYEWGYPGLLRRWQSRG